MFKKLAYALSATFPIVLFAFSTGPPIKRTGAPVDGGTNCSVCHRTFGAANSDPRGSVTIEAVNYTPGVTQTVKVRVQHPDAIRWGFQLTARLASDETKEAGAFAPNDLVRVRCDSTPAQDAPCNGTLEFADHSDAPFTDPGAGFTFQVDWTPPDTEAGDVMFYAAGNAANGDRNLTGDRIYTTVRTIPSANCNLTGKPVITGIGNGASFQPTIAANTIVTLFGRNFEPPGVKRAMGPGDIVNKTLPKQLACVAVEIDGKRVPISYIQSDQINVQAPTTPNLGPVSAKVILNPDRDNASTSDPATVQLLNLAPAFFTLDGKTISAQFAGTQDVVADASVFPTGKAAKPGDLITLYGTGFGPTSPPVQSGDVSSGLPKLTSPFTVTIGGMTLTAADIQYAGLSPGSGSWLYQFNVRVPNSAPDGNVPVAIQMGSSKTQDGATIPIRR